MFGNHNLSRFNITTLLNGISKSLNVANEVIPMYQKAKPFIKNSTKLLNTLKSISPNKPNTIKTFQSKKTDDNLNHPVFFV